MPIAGSVRRKFISVNLRHLRLKFVFIRVYSWFTELFELGVIPMPVALSIFILE